MIAMSKFHEDVKAELQELLEAMPTVEQATATTLSPSEHEDWGKGGETRQNDGRANDMVFHMLMQAFPKSWLKWAGDHISEARDKEQYEAATEMLCRVLADLGEFLSDRDWEGREVSVEQFYAEADPNFDTEDGFY